MASKRKLLGEILIEKGLLTEEQLSKALEIQKKTGNLLGKILTTMGLVSEKDVARAYSEQINIPYLNLDEVQIDLEAVRLLSKDFVVRRRIMPIKKDTNRLLVAMADPLNIFAIDEIRMLTHLEVDARLSSEGEILTYIDKYFKTGLSISEAIEDVKKVQDLEEVDVTQVEAVDAHVIGEEIDTAVLKEMGDEAPIVRMVNAIIMQAIRDRATDIHIEPQLRELRVRFRIDGVLHEAMSPPKRLQAAIISRVKIMSNLDIAEKRLPQDGRIMMYIGGKEYDFRIATIPTMFGEKVEIRILDKSTMLFKLTDLGFSEDTQKKFETLINKPYGMILATGPTGCGKTTTLYAVVQELNSPERNLITIEEPIEYQMDGVAQAQVNIKAGLTFANALRSILRQDPDIIMVGEIRDRETAQIAIHAALTGHLVLSTMHTNDAALTVVRFFHMGIEPFLLSSSLIGILSQRLARCICPRCKEAYETSPVILQKLGLSLDTKSITLYRGKGCDHCKYTGYYSRTGIFELMVIDDELREMIIRKASVAEIRDKAKSKGMKTLIEDALEKVLEGITTIEEALRVVFIR